MANKKKELYRVRKDWNDSKSQIGVYSILANAKKTCDKAGEGYYVFNSIGEVVYPEPLKEEIKLDIESVDLTAADPEEMNLQNTYEKSLDMDDADIIVPNKGMKYSDENPPMICMQTQSTCYKGTTTMKVKGILWHSTGANNPTLKRYVQPSDNAPDRAEMLELLGVNQYKNDWNHIERQAGLNAWIGQLADGTVTTIQTMPWNYKPWGCGSGSKGSCNSGWIQFEICEDGLKDKEYFDAAYKEACELSAYLCQMFDINPLGTVTHNGVTVPTILCHQDAYKLKLGSNHGDVLHWFSKHGKSMDDVRTDIAALLPESNKKEEVKEETSVIEPVEQFKVNDIVKLKEGAVYYNGKTISSWVFNQEWIVSAVNGDKVIINKSTTTKSAINSPVHQNNLILVKREEVVEQKIYYKVRKSWTDVKSQIGAYIKLENAIENCIKAGAGYSVYDNQGKAVYTVEAKPEEPDDGSLKIGSEVKLIPGAKYASGANIPQWLFGYKLYIREIRSNGNFVISTQKTGAVTGVVPPDAVVAHSTPMSNINFTPYIVRITADALNVRSGPGVQYKVNTVLKKNELYTIVGESNGWGRLKSGAGWISLENYTKKM